jgi:Arc/MetJ-type ribon-helix-helix transcriptional regulator
MTRKPRAYVAALPLSELPDLQELLRPFLGGKGPRERVVMVRLGEDGVSRLDELVDAGLFGSRSEAAAFLVGVGIQAQSELFERIGKQAAEIKRLRGELRKTALDALSAAAQPAGAPNRRRRTPSGASARQDTKAPVEPGAEKGSDDDDGR